MWPFKPRRRFIATDASRKAFGVAATFVDPRSAEYDAVVTKAVAEAINVTDLEGDKAVAIADIRPLPSGIFYGKAPNNSDDIAAMPADHHLKMAQRMVEKFQKRQAEIDAAIVAEFEQHRQTDEIELDRHREANAAEKTRHTDTIARLKAELEESVSLGLGYQGLRDTLAAPVEPPAPGSTFATLKRTATKRSRKPTPDVEPLFMGMTRDEGNAIIKWCETYNLDLPAEETGPDTTGGGRVIRAKYHFERAGGRVETGTIIDQLKSMQPVPNGD